jgi:alpha-tubulin suppressor-like RCC1 family protein
LADVRQIAAANSSACAVLVGGQARCWGWDAKGQLGDGTTGTQYDLPVAVQNPAGTGPLGGIAQLSMGYAHACARLTSDQLLCWGQDYAGGLGNGPGGDSPLPAFVLKPSGVGALTGVRAVSAGIDFTCARIASRQVRCWGYNGFGQVGDGTKIDRQLPVVVGG